MWNKGTAERQGAGPAAKASDKGGFSLVEVSLAVVLIGAGVVTLFALFPAGLREAELAVHDTHVGLFAEQAMSGLRAGAMTMSDFSVWTNRAQFRSQVVDTVPIYYEAGSTTLRGNGLPQTIPDFVQPGVGISYILTVSNQSLNVGGVFGGDRYKHVIYADLKVCLGNTFTAKDAQWFYTEFFYSGVP